MRVRTKLVVPLTMPRIRCRRSPASDSRSGRMSGIPPATAASNSRSTPAFSAASKSSAPTLARSSLLPVTTALPFCRAVRINSRAGSIPPMSSTTTSTDGSSTTDAASLVNRSARTSTVRCLAVLRTATRATSRRNPVRSAMASRCSSMSSTRAPPTLPQPSSPTLMTPGSTAQRYRPYPAVVAIRVVLAEDHYLVREGIRQLIEAQPELDLVAVCEDLASLTKAIDEQKPDVVLTDIRMPPTNTDEGIQAAEHLREQQPDAGVVVLSQYADPQYALAFLEHGSRGRGYLLKERVSEGEQ